MVKNLSQSFPEIVLLGDTSFGENYQLQVAASGGINIVETMGYDYSFARLIPLIEPSGMIVANLETPLTDIPVSPYRGLKKYLHWGDRTHTPFVLTKYGIKAVSLANNHLFDYGPEGLDQTLAALVKFGIDCFGAGSTSAEAAKTLTIETGDGVRPVIVATGFEYKRSYGVSGYGYYASESHAGVNLWTREAASRQIRSIRENNAQAFIIAYPHWGGNYQWKTKQQTDLGHLLIDSGADIVIGHGAHAAQEIESYEGKWIIYSLGNFIFNSPGRYRTGNGINASLVARLQLTVTPNGMEALPKLYPILSDNTLTRYQPRPLQYDEITGLFNRLSHQSGAPDHFARQLAIEKDDRGFYFALHRFAH